VGAVIRASNPRLPNARYMRPMFMTCCSSLSLQFAYLLVEAVLWIGSNIAGQIWGHQTQQQQMGLTVALAEPDLLPEMQAAVQALVQVGGFRQYKGQ
jgi:hypothetical protein